MYHYDRSVYPSSSNISNPPPMMMPPMMNASKKGLHTALIARSISYHGLPLQKMWEGERGESDLQQQGLLRPDYSIYQMRQKYLTFQDRAKRLKLHQFISKKANEVFDPNLLIGPSGNLGSTNDVEAVVQIPPYEVFLNVDPYERTRHFFQTIQRGDIVYGSVANVSKISLLIKIICATGSIQRFVGDLGIKATIPLVNTVPVFNKLNNRYDVNDYVCCEVLELSPESQKIVLTMKGEFPRNDDGSSLPPFGLITTDHFPEVYKTASETKNLTYNEVLENNSAFKNPHSEDVLFEAVGLNPKVYYTNMTSLKGKFPSNEYASQIRQDQASKWAFRSVAEGIEHFKEGRHSEAFSCLNKALSIDPRNVEGLVARGALYANSGSFKKAVEDFEAALGINSTHANARKYLGETLVALGRSYEEENKYEEAKNAYQDCLKVIPMHEEALNSLEYLRNRNQTKMIVPPTELALPPLNLNKVNKFEEHGKHSSHHEKKSKEKSKKRRKRHDSSSSDSSGSSGSSSSTSRSSSSSSDSSRTKRTKGKKRNETSPFSQQMMKGSHFNQPFNAMNLTSEVDDYESKVRQFLDMAREDDDHEDKVRKLIADAARYQEERKGIDQKSKKKKRKEEKKAKKEAKKKRKKDKKGKKSKLDLNDIENAKIREALKIFENLPVLDDLGAKLSEIYGVKNDATQSQTKTEPQNPPSKSIFEDTQKQNKWKMSFQNKDEHRSFSAAGPSTQQTRTASRPGKGLTPPDSDEETRSRVKDTKGGQSHVKRIPSPLKQFGRSFITRSPPPAPPPVKSGPVVLDKFGNFRLAEPVESVPTESIDRRTSRSRSRSLNYNNRRDRSGSSNYRRNNRRRRSRSRSTDYRRNRRSRSTSRDLYRRLAISRSRSRSKRRSPVRSYRREGPSYRHSRRSRSRSPMAISPIRSTNPLGRPFGGGRGRGTGRWTRGGFHRQRDRSYSRSPKRHRSRSRERNSERKRSHDDNTSNNKNASGKSSEQKNTENSDPPAPGTEDDVESVEKMMAHANKIRKEVLVKENPATVKNNS